MTAENVLWLCNFLSQNNISLWLDGGWGVDALLGRQTREHGDVDLVVEKKSVSKIRELLAKEGFKDVPRDDTKEENFVLGNQERGLIDIHVVVFDDEGNGIYGPAEKGVMYPTYSFKGEGMINDQTVKCLTAEYQVESHTGYKIDETDVKDVSALCNKFGIKYPDSYPAK